MTRRLRRTASRGALAVATLLALSSCSTFTEADQVAEVADHELDESTFAAMMNSPVAADVMQSVPFEGSVAGDNARGLIRTWIILHAIDDAGFVPAESKDAAREEISAGYGDDWSATPAEMQDLVVLNGAIGQLIGSGTVQEPDLIAAVRDADVRIASRYGRWDADVLTVSPLG